MEELQAPILNKVAQSSLVTLDLENYRPAVEVKGIDIASYLEGGYLLREKDFRAHVKALPLADYAGKAVALYCSTDAIVPTWAYMLMTLALQPVVERVSMCTVEGLKEQLWLEAVKSALSKVQFQDQKVVIKGCSEGTIPESAWVVATQVLGPVVSSLMFGEACSAVPLYKRPKGQS